MSAKLAHRIELAANVAIILLAVTLAGVVVYRFVLDPSPADPGGPPSPGSSFKGKKVEIPGVEFSSDRTLILVVQKDCRFCTESMPFYRALAARQGESGMNIIGVVPHSAEEGARYFSENGVELTAVKQVNFGSLSIKGTPTVLLVDANGDVLEAWVGKLSNEGENEVMASL